MPHADSLISTLVAAFVLAFVLGVAANRLKLSPLVGYLLAGVVVGPFTPGFVADTVLAPQLRWRRSASSASSSPRWASAWGRCSRGPTT